MGTTTKLKKTSLNIKKPIQMMKAKLLLALTVLLATNVHAQWFNVGSTTLSGISTTTPGNCSIQGGTIDMSMPADASLRIITANSTTGALSLQSGPVGAGMVFRTGSDADRPGTIDLLTTGPSSSPTGGPNGYTFYYYNPSSPTPYSALMHIWNDGKVVIGNDIYEWSENQYGYAPSGYNLYVSQGILTDKLKVAMHTDPANWSDFVFAKSYKLMPLAKVEEYVGINKHLPDVPSAQEVSNNGIDVASMDAKLLQKIEELTLYVIQQQKEIEDLKSKMK